MRLVGLIITLALILWLTITYMKSTTGMRADVEGDASSQQRTRELINEANDTARALQESMNAQTKHIEKSE